MIVWVETMNTYLKSNMDFLRNTVKRELMVQRKAPENLTLIWQAIAEQSLFCFSLVHMHFVSVTGGPFEVYDVTGNTYNVLPPLVVKNEYRLREDITGGWQ